MKVLWIVHSLFPEAESLLRHKKIEIQGTGGWLSALADALALSDEVELYVAGFSPLVSQTKLLRGERYSYYILPHYDLRRNDKRCEPIWKELYKEFNPDIVHIHGTEYTHGLTFVNACGNNNVVVSIQGMPSVICDYMYSGLSENEIRKNITLKTILNGNLLKERKIREKTTKQYEIELLCKVNNVIGRTSWDKAHTWAINPLLNYYHCNEALRDSFYEGCWSYDNCEHHTIFLSQVGRALKGAHQLFKALPIILYHYPDTRVKIAGNNVVDVSTLKKRMRISGYGKILRKMIKTYKLENVIKFTGPLDAEKMKNEYLRTNVFVSPSSIENSPNSLCEAQILGVPCVASYVGGTMDFIPNPNCGLLYRFDDIEMLAKTICDTFESASKFDNTEMREQAHSRHDKESIVKTQLDIYHKILG